MGVRARCYATYYAIQSLLVGILAVLLYATVLPSVNDCRDRCPVDVMAPNLLVGASGVPCSNTDPEALYANSCMQCYSSSTSTALVVEWMCAPSSGLPQCLVPTYLYAVPCTTPGLFNLTTLAGAPISSPATYGGPGMYLSSSSGGRKMLCFTVPLRITLRSFVFPAFVTLLACYAAWAAITGLLACLTGPFTRVTGGQWSNLTRVAQCSSVLIKRMPIAVSILNYVVLVLLALDAFVIWSTGVCSDAPDAIGRYTFFSAASSALAFCFAIFGVTCLSGGCMRLFVARDPAFANPIEIAADSVAIDREVGESDDVEEAGADDDAASAAQGGAGKKPPQRRKRGACARIVANVCDIVGKLGP